MARIGVIGAGSIGSVLAKGFDELGHTVTVNDTDTDAALETGYAMVPKQEMASWADYIIITVPTPTTDQGGDPSHVDAALDELGDTGATVIIRSTMPPGTTQSLADEHDIPLIYSPEFLRDRSGVADFFDPDRVVVAGPAGERDAVVDLFTDERIDCETYIQTRDYLTAEIAKEAHNAFFATKVTFANQMRLICEQEGADVGAVMSVVTADERNTTSHLDPYLGPYGGKCLPKDTEALTLYGDHQGADVNLLEAVMELNATVADRYESREIEGNWPNLSVSGD